MRFYIFAAKINILFHFSKGITFFYSYNVLESPALLTPYTLLLSGINILFSNQCQQDSTVLIDFFTITKNAQRPDRDFRIRE